VFRKLLAIAGTIIMLALSQLAVAQTAIVVSATPSSPVAPATVTLSVSAAPGSAPVAVTQVEYFRGKTSLGIALNAPFSLTVPDMAAGTYTIIAKAKTTDASNPVVQSAPLSLTVGTPIGAASANFIHTDQLNTPRAIANGSGNLVWQWDSDPFGKDAANEQPAGQGPLAFNSRFPGQQFDQETGLHYNYYRDYDPALGRYVESDPIGLDGGINTYGYVEGDPLGKSDFYGLQSDGTRIYVPCPPWGCLGLPKAADPVSGAPISNVMDEDRGRGRESSSRSRSRDRTRDCPPDKEECERQWREARLQCRARIYEQMEQAAGRRKKRSVKGVTGGYTDVEECARGLVSEECGGNKKRY
jgi:RHS repeat-associated protein